ncbi:MAG: ATPase domain-containing protein [Nitrososphaerota archaeon]|nr:hypothetical protein [Candidatus Bathyarchaeota archaeon]MDW8049149.1 ATPase domain-containing protein [Nitrososphaerota archaeon]
MISETARDRRGVLRSSIERPFALIEAGRTVREAQFEAQILGPRNVPSGITGLDTFLDGGLPDRSLLLILGETGSHYETFVQQVMINHLSNGGRAAYYLTENLAVDIRQKMEIFRWSLKEYIGRGDMVFINLRTPTLEEIANLMPQILIEGLNLTVSKGLNSLKSDILVKTREERWIILELGQLLREYGLNDVLSLLHYWRAAVRVYGGIHFALLPIGVHQDSEVNAIEHLADGVIEFYLRDGPREFDNIMVIRKLPGVRKALSLNFTVSENGLIIETAARIS